MLFTQRPASIPSVDEALPGRQTPLVTAEAHHVSGRPLKGPYPDGAAIADLGLGCFWGAERVFWTMDGVWVTAVGYQGGHTPNPTYEEVCSGRTGHAEVVRVVFDPSVIGYDQIVQAFFEAHDPTQGMRQGADRGTQYRSAVYTHDAAQLEAATAVRDAYQRALSAQGFGAITTEIAPAGPFYFAEDYHQQYLSKNPGGYCGIGGVGVACPVGLGAADGAR